MMMEKQELAPPGPPSAKHGLCQMTRQELMSPDCGSLKVGDPCPGCRTLDGRFAPVCVHPSAPVAPVDAEEILGEKIIAALDCSVIIKAMDCDATGRGVAVNKTMLLTALHGFFKEGDKFEVIDRHGKSRKGTVKATWYEASCVDIAIIQLSESSTQFEHFIQVHKKPIKLGAQICIIGLKPTLGPEEFSTYYEPANVTTIIGGTSLFHSRYLAEDGMSGCPVVVSRDFTLVGVHVASHDKKETVDVELRPTKRQKGDSQAVTQEEFADAMMTVNSNVHGHGAYTIVCEMSRVDGLLAQLNQ